MNASSHSASFDLTRVRSLLGAQANRFDVDHIAQCDSTNLRLLERALHGSGAGTVLVADAQSAGRGRRGRRWVSAPGASLSFSLLWRFASTQRLEGLSLAVGLAIVRGLETLGAKGLDAKGLNAKGLNAKGLALKWPNDIWLTGRKLGGVLVEVAHSPGEVAAVIGIGLNLRSLEEWKQEIDQPFAALDEAGVTADRETCVAAILSALLPVLEQFGRAGFAPFMSAWMQHHAMLGAPVRVLQHTQEIEGICGAVDALGRLEVSTAQGLMHIFAGEVSLRVARPEAGEPACAS